MFAMVMLLFQLVFASPAQPVLTPAQSTPAQQKNTPPPPGFPTITFKLNPSYNSIGLKLGHILNVHRERPIFSTFEGELGLGYGSSSGYIIDRQCARNTKEIKRSPKANDDEDESSENEDELTNHCVLSQNPWRFSFLDDRIYDDLRRAQASPVLIYYVRYYYAPSQFLTKTKNKALAVFPIVPNLGLIPSYRIPAWPRIHPEAGHVTGRIVQASLESPLRKTYEVIIQDSQNTDSFRAMSVSDSELFRYITYAMLTGRQVNIEYVRLYKKYAQGLTLLFNYLSQYRVISVELL